MTPDKLVQKVAQDMAWMETHAYEYCLTHKWEDYARAAIAVALEEAAKVCHDPCPECAAAIRTMIKEGK